jgi:fibronectin-binding autotransporter adhesin
MALMPRVSVAWQRVLGDVAPAASLGYEGTGVGFSVYDVPLAPNTAVVEIGLDLAITRLAMLGISYSGFLADSAKDQSINGNLLGPLKLCGPIDRDLGSCRGISERIRIGRA